MIHACGIRVFQFSNAHSVPPTKVLQFMIYTSYNYQNLRKHSDNSMQVGVAKMR